MTTATNDLRTLRSTLRSLLAPCFGPIGTDVLLSKSTGGCLTTNNGYLVLESIQLQHPLARLMLDVATKRHQEFGDGSSSLLLCLADGIEAVERRMTSVAVAERSFSKAKLARSLSMVRRRVLEDYIQPSLHRHSELLQWATTSHTSLAEPPDAEQARVLRAVAQCVLCRQFSPSTCRVLADLAVATVAAAVAGGDDIKSRLSELINAGTVGSVVREVIGRPVSESRVLTGLLIPVASIRQQRECERWLREADTPSGTTNTVVTLLDTTCNELSSSAASIRIQSQDGMSGLLDWQGRANERIVRAIIGAYSATGCYRHIVLVSSPRISEELAKICHHHGVLVLSCSDGKRGLFQLAGRCKVPVLDATSLSEISPSDCVYVRKVDVLTIGDKSHLHLTTQQGQDAWPTVASLTPGSAHPCTRPGVRDPFSAEVHVIVCASNAPLCRLYANNLMSCLRAIRSSLQPSGQHSNMHQKAQSTCRKLNTSIAAGKPNKEPNTEQRQDKTSSSVLHNDSKRIVDTGKKYLDKSSTALTSDPSAQDQDAYLTSVMPGGGLAELLAYTALSQLADGRRSILDGLCKSEPGTGVRSDDLCTACRILGESLAAVPSTLHSPAASNRLSAFSGGGGEQCRFLTCCAAATAQANVSGDGFVLDMCGTCAVLRNGARVLESVDSKFRLMVDVCLTLEQLLRIDAIVRTKKSIASIMHSTAGERRYGAVKSRLRRCGVSSDNSDSDEKPSLCDWSDDDDSP